MINMCDIRHWSEILALLQYQYFDTKICEENSNFIYISNHKLAVKIRSPIKLNFTVDTDRKTTCAEFNARKEIENFCFCSSVSC